MKQTAVEWLMDKYRTQNGVITAADYHKAKEMDKEIICTAYLDGIDDEYTTSEQYYNETFKSE